MKRSIIFIAAAALLIVGCKDYSYETWTPDQTLSRTGEVSLLANFENLQTKVFMDEKGHGTWEAADEIAERVGFPADSRYRIRCALLHVLSQTLNEGSSYLPEPELTEEPEPTVQPERAVPYRTKVPWVNNYEMNRSE